MYDSDTRIDRQTYRQTNIDLLQMKLKYNNNNYENVLINKYLFNGIIFQ